MELYFGDVGAELLLADLRACKLVQRLAGGCRIAFAASESGHGDRLAALLQVLVPMLRAMGSMPLEAGGAASRDEEVEVIDTRPEWERKALRPIGGWQYGNRR